MHQPSKISSRVSNRRVAILRQSQKVKLKLEKEQQEILKRKRKNATFEVSLESFSFLDHDTSILCFRLVVVIVVVDDDDFDALPLISLVACMSYIQT